MPPRKRKRVRRIIEKQFGSNRGIIARTVKGESEPRSFKKVSRARPLIGFEYVNELNILEYLRKKGIKPMEFRIIRNTIYTKAAGKTVHEIRHKIGEKNKIKILSQTADLLGKIHSAGVAHNDVHEWNLLWAAKKEKVSLIDFGRARKTGIIWPIAGVHGIAKSFNADYRDFGDFIELLLEKPSAKEKEKLFARLISHYPLTKKRKQELLKSI